MCVTKRTTISISEPIYDVAQQLMEARKFGNDFSNFVQSLIREEWERRQTTQPLHETSQPVPPPSGPASKVHRYSSRKPRRKVA